MLSGLLLACAAQARAGVPEDPRFRAIGIGDGLPSSSVNAIARDHEGYVWIATADGLARHDGLGFRVWRHDPADPGSLPGNNVQALHVDGEDNVWVATEAGGLSRLDRQRGRFRQFRKARDPRIGSDDTWAIASHAGVLWFGTWGGGLHRLDRRGDITRFMPVPGDPRSLPATTVLALAFDAAGRLWIGTTRGLACWNGHGFERVSLPGAVAAPVVYAIVAGADGLWVGSAAGLHHRSADGRWRDPAWARQFARPDAMTALARDAGGRFWIGSQRGLWRVGSDGHPRQVRSGGADAGQAVTALLLDEDGAIWTSLPGIGVGYLRADWRQLAQFSGAGRSRYRSVAPSRSGGVWLAVSTGAPVRLDAAGKLHPLPRATREVLHDARFRALVEDRRGVLWAGGPDALARIDRGGTVRLWRAGDAPDGIPGGIDLLRVAPDGTLWMSCAGAGVQQRSDAGAVLRDWRAGSHGVGSADNEAMAMTADGAVWVAGDGGVSVLRGHAARFVPVPGMGRARAYALAFDGDGVAWLSRTTGLARYRRVHGRWRREAVIGVDRGIPAVEAAGLVVDARHRPWLSTTRGLFLSDARRGRALKLGLQDALESQEFTPRGLTLAGDGILAATTRPGGVVLVDTATVPAPSVRHSLALADVAMRDSGHWRPLSPVGLRLPPGARELRVRMRLPAYAAPRSTRYESLLQGYDRDWLRQEGGERVVAGLRPGRYVLRMRATDASGHRSPERILRWQVLPPWWRTRWAMAGAAALFLLTAWLLAVGAKSRLRERRRIERLEQRHALAEEASRSKSRFLANLGHEVRTPMTGVLGMSELLLGTALDARQRRHVEAIHGAGEHLLRLVDDALDMARIEAGKLALDVHPFALRALVANVSALQAPLARRRGLRFLAEVDEALPDAFHGDALRIKQVLFNLLGNAVKFTARGEVGLRVSACPGTGSGLAFTVHDTGPGLDHAQQSRLFRRFEQADGGRTTTRYGGSGLGLAISQELALAMGGRIGVQSSPGAGAVFTLELPLAPAPGYSGIPCRNPMMPAM